VVLCPPFDESTHYGRAGEVYLAATARTASRFGGGGTAQIEPAAASARQTKTLNEIPRKGLRLNEDGSRPANPASVLFPRMATCDAADAAPASEVVDSEIGSYRAMDPLPARRRGPDDSSFQARLTAVGRDSCCLITSRALEPFSRFVLFLARSLDSGRLPAPFSAEVIAAAPASSNQSAGAVRDPLPAPPPPCRPGSEAAID